MSGAFAHPSAMLCHGDPEAWHFDDSPLRDLPNAVTAAVRACWRCPVRVPCAERALAAPPSSYAVHSVQGALVCGFGSRPMPLARWKRRFANAHERTCSCGARIVTIQADQRHCGKRCADAARRAASIPADRFDSAAVEAMARGERLPHTMAERHAAVRLLRERGVPDGRMAEMWGLRITQVRYVDQRRAFASTAA